MYIYIYYSKVNILKMIDILIDILKMTKREDNSNTIIELAK